MITKFGTCKKCNSKHNSLLHNDNANTVAFHSSRLTEAQSERYHESAVLSAAPPVPATRAPSSADVLPIQVQVNKSHFIQNECNTSTECVLLSTAVVEVADKQGVYHKACALLDNGSQSCL